MDIWSQSHTVNDVKSLHGLCMDNQESDNEVVGDFSVDELAYGATKFLNIQDGVEGVMDSLPPPPEKGVSVFQKKAEHGEEAHQSKIITEPHEDDDAHVITSENITQDDNAKFVHPHCSRAPSLLPSKPISAMKGSREKHGLTLPKKLTVKWAPDVYDPVPASSLHTVVNRPRKHGKKRSKSKQKNLSKSSRGSKGKDKKQVYKNTGFKLYEHKEEVICVPEIHQPSGIDFHLVIPEHACGGSNFVNTFGSSLHLSSVTQAT